MSSGQDVYKRQALGYEAQMFTLIEDGAFRLDIQPSIAHDPEELLAYLTSPISLEWKTESGEVVFSLSSVSGVTVVGEDEEATDPELSYTLNDTAKTTLSEFSATYAQTGQKLLVYLNGEVICEQTFEKQITDGTGRITGDFDLEGATRLAAQINGGAFPISFEVTHFQYSALEDAAATRQTLIVIGFVLLAAAMIFLAVCFRGKGLLADLSLLALVMLVLFCLGTLPSVVLTPVGLMGLYLGFVLDVYKRQGIDRRNTTLC